MPDYQVSGAVVRSAVPLPEVAAVAGASPDLTFELAESIDADDVTWYHEWVDDEGTPTTCFGRHGRTRYIIRFPDLADFQVERTTRPAITCAPAQETSIETIRMLFLDQLLPLVLNRGSRIVVHAAVVAIPEGAVAFVGGSGSGKSTLCAACCAAGDAMIADDAAVLSVPGAVIAYPSYPSVRLRHDSLAALVPGAAIAPGADEPKVRILPEARLWRVAPAPATLLALFVLTPAAGHDAPGMTPLSRRDGLAALLPHVYRLDPLNSDDMEREIHLLSRLAAATPIGRLHVPRAYASLSAVRQIALAAARSSAHR